MALCSFLNSLAEHGRVKVTPPQAFDTADVSAAARVLEDWDRRARLELAHAAPAFHAEAAMWGAQKLYRTCQSLVFRHATLDPKMSRQNSAQLPQRSPAVDYSVDLTFRYLPDFEKLARAAAPNDAIEKELATLLQTWPLSSVGSKFTGALDVSSFIDHEALRQLYVDRIIARRDLPRLGDPRVCDAARAAIGLFPFLAPEIATAIQAADGP